MVKNQKVLCEPGDFSERTSHSGSGKNTGFGSNQWTKAEPMFKIKQSFLLENCGINEECLEEKEQDLHKNLFQVYKFTRNKQGHRCFLTPDVTCHDLGNSSPERTRAS